MKKKLLVPFVVLVSLITITHYMNWDDRLYYFFISENKEDSINLSEYQLQSKVVLDGVVNLSGVTYNEKNKTLFLVTNNPTKLIECSINGRILNTYILEGFKDTEGLCFTPNGHIAILEERIQTLSICELPTTDKVIKKDSALKEIILSIYENDNKAFEGISYSLEQDCFYIVKEKNPPSLLQVRFSESSLKVNHVTDFKGDYLDDYSDIFCKEKSLLVLSDEAALLSEVNYSGEVLSFLELDEGFNGLEQRIPQAEGVCLDSSENLYIVSEPNILYFYTKPGGS